jgi:CRISPR-associated endonuclease Cas2
MADKPMLRIIAYGIGSDRRRRRIADALEAQAARVQESVFESRLTHRQAERLMADLQRLSGPGDSIRLYTVPDGLLLRCVEHGGPAIDGGGRFWLL